VSQHTKDAETETEESEGGAEQDSLSRTLARLGGRRGEDGEGPDVAALAAEHRGKIITGVIVLVVVATFGVLEVSLGRVLVEGVREGAVIAMVALGLALIYKSTGVLNFAQGEFGTVPAFVVLTILVGGNLASEVDTGSVGALQLTSLTLVAILAGVLLAIAVNLLVIRRLANASPFTSLVATAGIFTLLGGMQLVIFEPRARSFPRYLDGSPCLASSGGECTNFLSMFGTRIAWHSIIVLFVLVIVAALLALLFRTPVGVALLASSQEPFAASLYGVSPKAMSTLAWGAAGALGGLAGVLGAGVFERVSPAFMTRDLLIPAFTAAVLGGITSMVGAVLGGMILGIVVSFANTSVLTYGMTDVLPNPPAMASFAVLLLVLYFRPNGLFGKGS
jgi:branched-chain amino acid transport system permease protein